jgi:rhodanese-related sulfurtransferase
MFSVAKTDYARLISEGAVILDVRSQREYGSGHIAGSVNIPVNKLSENLHKLEAKNKTIIACCASGMRSASAKSLLESKGYTKVINGGSWQSLDKKIKS